MDLGTIFLRIGLAVLLSGLIGLERETIRRPAGLRTHILVCVGSVVAMITSEYLFGKYAGHTNIDPARLGAQVISGVGFLGTGTIIRNGANVKGLTTAASLWAVACVGLAVGIGFYSGAVVGTGIIYITLFLLGKIERAHSKKKSDSVLTFPLKDNPARMEIISKRLTDAGIQIKGVELFASRENELSARYIVSFPAASGAMPASVSEPFRSGAAYSD